jgi:hypothetical protein
MILAIMNKVKPRELLLYSIIGIEHNRLEQLALDQCNPIDLTFDYHPHEILVKELISYTLPCIFNYIESLTINAVWLQDFIDAVQRIDDENCLNLKHLKIMGGRLYNNTGTPYTTGKLYSHPAFFSNI